MKSSAKRPAGGKLAIGKRKRESEAQPTPSKRFSHTSKSASSNTTSSPAEQPNLSSSKRALPTPTAAPAASTATTTTRTSTKTKSRQQSPPSAASATADFSPLKGFFPLPVQLHADSSSAARYLYYRPHHPTASDDNSDSDIPADRTLLVVNIPFYYTATQLTELFSCFGDVQSAIFLSQHHTTRLPLLLAPLDQSVYETASVSSGLDGWHPEAPHPYYRSARIIFISNASLTTATTLAPSIATTVQPYIPPPSTAQYGMELLIAQYSRQRPNIDSLRSSINSFMAQFDSTERERQQAARTAQQDDGWTTVRTKRSRSSSGQQQQDEEAERLEQMKRKEEKKRASVAGLGFYRFQGAEKKQTQLLELRRKFDEDKVKIAAMKANRKFKPL